MRNEGKGIWGNVAIRKLNDLEKLLQQFLPYWGRCGGLAHRRGGWGVTKYAPGGRLPPFIKY